MNNSLKIMLKNYMENKEYLKYNELLRQEIISIFVKKIQEIDSSFLYSSMVELLEVIEEKLTEEDSENFKYFYNLFKKDYEPKDLTEYLTKVYKKIEN